MRGFRPGGRGEKPTRSPGDDRRATGANDQPGSIHREPRAYRRAERVDAGGIALVLLHVEHDRTT
jgi:hypothetical protein